VLVDGVTFAKVITPVFAIVGVTPEALAKLPKFVIDHSVGELLAAKVTLYGATIPVSDELSLVITG
jgi:uncharacterized protein YcsI (UPF0317 family)